MPADIKFQFVAGKEILTDLRGDKFVGKEQGDHHRTIAEIEDAPDDIVAIALELAPRINAAAAEMFDLLEKIGMPKDRVLKGLSILMGEDVTDAEYAGAQVRVYTD